MNKTARDMLIVAAVVMAVFLYLWVWSLNTPPPYQPPLGEENPWEQGIPFDPYSP